MKCCLLGQLLARLLLNLVEQNYSTLIIFNFKLNCIVIRPGLKQTWQNGLSKQGYVRLQYLAIDLWLNPTFNEAIGHNTLTHSLLACPLKCIAVGQFWGTCNCNTNYLRLGNRVYFSPFPKQHLQCLLWIQLWGWAQYYKLKCG